jgi:hypothetical protein
LANESTIQQCGDPKIAAVTAEGKLLGMIDEKSSTQSYVYAAPTFTGSVVFGSTGIVSFFGMSANGKAGVGLENVVGIAPKEAKYLVAVSADGRILKFEQSPDLMKSIPCFLKGSNTIFGGGAWDGDVLIAWDAESTVKVVKLDSVALQRKNSNGQKIGGSFTPVKAMIVRRGQKLMSLSGQEFTVRDPSNLNSEKCVSLGARNIIFTGSRRKIVDMKTAVAEIMKRTVTAAYDVTLPTAQAT